MGPLCTPLSLCCCCVAYVFWIFSEIAHFSISSFGMRFDFCGHISSSFVKRNQRRVTPQTPDWLKKEKRSRREEEGAWWQVAGAQGSPGISVSGESGSLRGRKLFNGAYMSNIARRKSRTERRRREVVAAAAAVDVNFGSCSCCWKLREIFLLFNLIRIPTFYWRLWRRRCSNIKKRICFRQNI